ncbi:MAG: STAS domain-containing protein [Nitrospinota bacterium]|nr:STAS domain-containing protein [Nitrospinota bacterium]MDH5756773.1 STAS domain-containing protein [Nitrospinota bacterium]
MEATLRDKDNVTIIELRGSIKTNEDYDIFKSAIDQAIEKGTPKVLLNFRDVNFINSSGLGRLILAAKIISEDHGQLKITDLSEDLRELFVFTRLDSKIPIYSSEEEALSAFN